MAQLIAFEKGDSKTYSEAQLVAFENGDYLNFNEAIESGAIEILAEEGTHVSTRNIEANHLKTAEKNGKSPSIGIINDNGTVFYPLDFVIASTEGNGFKDLNEAFCVAANEQVRRINALRKMQQMSI
jgi:hypothetical protein